MPAAHRHGRGIDRCGGVRDEPSFGALTGLLRPHSRHRRKEARTLSEIRGGITLCPCPFLSGMAGRSGWTRIDFEVSVWVNPRLLARADKKNDQLWLGAVTRKGTVKSVQPSQANTKAGPQQCFVSCSHRRTVRSKSSFHPPCRQRDSVAGRRPCRTPPRRRKSPFGRSRHRVKPSRASRRQRPRYIMRSICY